MGRLLCNAQIVGVECERVREPRCRGDGNSIWEVREDDRIGSGNTPWDDRNLG